MAVFNVSVIKFYFKNICEFLLEFLFIRVLFVALSILFYLICLHIAQNRYKAVGLLLKCQKILSEFQAGIIGNFIDRYCNKVCLTKTDELFDSYFKSSKSKRYRAEFCRYGKSYASRIKFPKKVDDVVRQGDLIVLKPYLCNREKGVLLIKYNDSFERFLALFDLKKISKMYRIVLEPSTWGYQDVALGLFRGLNTDVIVQAQCEEDFDYIKGIKDNLIPIRIGAGDWGDADLFTRGVKEKKYDVIMVASWQLLKRHKLFFTALSKIKPYLTRVCLVGYPTEGRTKNDIITDAKTIGVNDLIDIFENITPVQVARKISMSKISVMLTKREGASKVIYESLFCDVPVLLSNKNRGVNRAIINSQTGTLSSDKNLANNILRMTDNYKCFSPRDWAIENTGYLNSFERLNNLIKEISIENEEKWTQNLFMKKNAPNPIYVKDKERLLADQEFLVLEKLLVC